MKISGQTTCHQPPTQRGQKTISTICAISTHLSNRKEALSWSPVLCCLLIHFYYTGFFLHKVREPHTIQNTHNITLACVSNSCHPMFRGVVCGIVQHFETHWCRQICAANYSKQKEAKIRLTCQQGESYASDVYNIFVDDD